jgi:flagellar FliL protein
VKKKLIIVVAVLLVLGGGAGAYFFVLAPKPASAAKKKDQPKIVGSLFTLTPDFVVNLAGGHFGKLTVALLLKEPPVLDATATDPTLVQGAVIRATITDALTGLPITDLVDNHKRTALMNTLLKDLNASTDTVVTRVYVTDVVVQ